MLKFYYDFFRFSEKIEFFISIIFLYVGILYSDIAMDLQLLFLFTIVVIGSIGVTSGISSLIEIKLKTKRGKEIEALRISEGIEKYYLYFSVVIPLLLSFVSYIVVMKRLTSYILFIIVIIFVLEILYSMSKFDIRNNLLAVLIRLAMNTLLIGICFVDVVGSNILIFNQSFLSINLSMIGYLFILFTPIFILFLNYRIQIYVEENNIKFSKKNLEISCFIFSSISIISLSVAIVYEYLPLYFIATFIGIPVLYYFVKRLNAITFSLYSMLVYILGYIILLLLATYF